MMHLNCITFPDPDAYRHIYNAITIITQTFTRLTSHILPQLGIPQNPTLLAAFPTISNITRQIRSTNTAPRTTRLTIPLTTAIISVMPF